MITSARMSPYARWVTKAADKATDRLDLVPIPAIRTRVLGPFPKESDHQESQSYEEHS
jgi:hypothetical protein